MNDVYDIAASVTLLKPPMGALHWFDGGKGVQGLVHHSDQGCQSNQVLRHHIRNGMAKLD